MMPPPPLRLHVPRPHNGTNVATSSFFEQSGSEPDSLDDDEAHIREVEGVDGDDGKLVGYNTDSKTAPCRPKQKRRRDPQNCVGQ